MCRSDLRIRWMPWPHGWNAHWVMKQALTARVDQEEERHRMTLEALDDVDAGRVIDHQEIRAWADSLNTDEPLSPPVR